MSNKPKRNNAKASEKQLSASERLELIETFLKQVASAYEVVVSDTVQAKENVNALSNKLNALVSILSSGDSVNDENIKSVMVQNKIAELKSAVDDLVKRGDLEKAEVVGPYSFVVSKELSNDEEKRVINPRLQFAVYDIPKERAERLVGKKVGDIVELQENKALVDIEEIYDFPPIKDDNAPDQQGNAIKPE